MAEVSGWLANVVGAGASGGGTRRAGRGGTPAGWFFIVELAFLGGRARLSGAPVEALAAYD
jgi:hypothetical protein